MRDPARMEEGEDRIRALLREGEGFLIGRVFPCEEGRYRELFQILRLERRLEIGGGQKGIGLAPRLAFERLTPAMDRLRRHFSMIFAAGRGIHAA